MTEAYVGIIDEDELIELLRGLAGNSIQQMLEEISKRHRMSRENEKALLKDLQALEHKWMDPEAYPVAPDFEPSEVEKEGDDDKSYRNAMLVIAKTVFMSYAAGSIWTLRATVNLPPNMRPELHELLKRSFARGVQTNTKLIKSFDEQHEPDEDEDASEGT